MHCKIYYTSAICVYTPCRLSSFVLIFSGVGAIANTLAPYFYFVFRKC